MQFFKQFFRLIRRKNTQGKKILLFDKSRNKKIELKSPLKLAGVLFAELYWGARHDSLWGVSSNKEKFIKIGLVKHDRKQNSVQEEAKIIAFLNERNAQSAPMLCADGNVSCSELKKNFSSEELLGFLDGANSDNFSYYITDFCESHNECGFADVVFALIEQKCLGVYQGDVKPANIRFTPDVGVCVLVDYDQAEMLDQETMDLSNEEFFKWVDKRQREQYKEGGWLRHFKNINLGYLQRFFRNGSFNLASTTLYSRQQTTNTDSGVYHTIASKYIYADGVREISSRSERLDLIEFSEREKVLDIGCNIGLLSMYLAKRGCVVHGYELDPYIVRAAKMVNNILGNKIHFENADLDSHEFRSEFDTVMLFSVFHHTKDITGNGQKIAAICKRIIIECRLVERGRKPDSQTGKWQQTSIWEFADLQELYLGLESFFPGFRFYSNHGDVDKGRYIIELRK